MKRAWIAAAVFFASSTAHAEETVHVRVESAGPITLSKKLGGAHWKTVCTAPCNIAVPLDDAYRVSGASIAPSDEFRLRKTAGGNADVVVHESSRSRYTAGGLVVGMGGLAIAGGVAAAIVGAAWAGQDCDAIKPADTRAHCEGLEDDGAKVRNIGLVAVGVGVVAVLTGAWLMIDSARTTVKQPGMATRAPTWHAKTSFDAGARVVQIPLVSASF